MAGAVTRDPPRPLFMSRSLVPSSRSSMCVCAYRCCLRLPLSPVSLSSRSARATLFCNTISKHATPTLVSPDLLHFSLPLVAFWIGLPPVQTVLVSCCTVLRCLLPCLPLSLSFHLTIIRGICKQRVRAGKAILDVRELLITKCGESDREETLGGKASKGDIKHKLL